MNLLPIHIAKRYLRGSRHEKSISIMVQLCFFGIMIGTFALALILFVMAGFEKVTHEKLQGIHAQVIVRAYGNPLNVEQMSRLFKNEFPTITHYSPSSVQQVIIESDKSEERHVVMLKAVDPKTEAGISNFEQKIIAPLQGEKKLSSIVHGNRVAIGKSLADTLEVSIGDPISLIFADPQQTGKKSIKFQETKAVVGGIFSIGIDEFDTSLVLCDFPFFNQLFPDTGITQLNLKLADNADEQTVINALRNRLGIEVYSWKDLYPALVSALKLEKYVMFFILALITLVASMSIISLLFMQITQKRSDIAILKAMGMQDKAIRSIFLIMGMGITLTASLCGLALAGIAGWLLERYPFITLPDVYYVTHLPIAMEFSLFLLVFCVTTALGFLATWIPSQKIKTIQVADVLRFDA